MIETLSPAAQIAENAANAMARISDEITSLQATSEQNRAEMRDLLAEQATAAQRKHDLAAMTTAARADLHKCELTEEMSMGTAREQEAREATRAASALWDAARHDEQAYGAEWAARAHLVEERLNFLKISLDEAAAMSQELQARREGLRDIYDSARADHGKHEQSKLEEEFAVIAENRKAVLHMLAEVDQQEQALRETIVQRLHDWPALARETLAAHLDYQPGAMHQILTRWEHAATIAGDQSEELDARLWHAYLGETTAPLWHLQQYGPRKRYLANRRARIDEPLLLFENMRANLRTALENIEQSERTTQVDARLHAAGL